MAVKASATITLFDIVDIDSLTTYYKLQSSTAAIPAKPTTDTPSDWSTTEPTYTEGSTNTLYTVIKTKYSDGTFEYTPVSKSSSYEAAKNAYNKAKAAQDNINDLQIGGRNLVLNSRIEHSNNKYNIANYNISSHENDVLSNGYGYLIPGEEYTISICLTPTTDVTYISPFVSSAYQRLSSIYTDGSSNKQIISSTFIAKYYSGRTPSDNPNHARVSLYRYPNPTDKNYENITIHWVKIERGNKPTDWTPAPEDIDNEINNNSIQINQRIVDQKTEIIAETEAIILNAATDYITTGDYESFKESIKSEFEVLSNEITMKFASATNSISDLESSVSGDLETIKKYFQFNENGITIGSGQSAIKLTIDNDNGIEFTKNGERFGYWDGNDFYTGNIVVRVNEKAQFGNYAYLPRDDGSLIFQRIK